MAVQKSHHRDSDSVIQLRNSAEVFSHSLSNMEQISALYLKVTESLIADNMTKPAAAQPLIPPVFETRNKFPRMSYCDMFGYIFQMKQIFQAMSRCLPEESWLVPLTVFAKSVEDVEWYSYPQMLVLAICVLLNFESRNIGSIPKSSFYSLSLSRQLSTKTNPEVILHTGQDTTLIEQFRSTMISTRLASFKRMNSISK